MPAVLLLPLPLLLTRAHDPLLAAQSIARSIAALVARSDLNLPLLIPDEHLILLVASAGPLSCFA